MKKALLKGNRICERCDQEKSSNLFNPAFSCCNGCVTEADYDSIQPEISKLMRGFSPLEKQNILRESFYCALERTKNTQQHENKNGQANQENRKDCEESG